MLQLLPILLCLSYNYCLASSGSAIQQRTPQKHIDAEVGRSVTLPCYSDVSSSVDWRFLGETDEHDKDIVIGSIVINGWIWRAHLDSDGHGNHNFVIPRPLANESGIYTCINGSGFGYRYEIRLIVRDIYLLMPSYSTRVRQPIMLPCFTNLTAPVDWTFKKIDSSEFPVSDVVRNGKPIDAWRDKVRVESSRGGEYSLVLTNPQSGDSGIYSCVEDAGLGEGYMQHSFILNVTNSTSPTTTVIESGPVAFSCLVNNASMIRWQFRATGSLSDQTIYNGEASAGKYRDRMNVYFTSDRLLNVLLLQGISGRDSGIYSCSPHDTALRKQFFTFASPIPDINECLTNNGECHEHTLCTNVPGSFYCRCWPGYTGVGVNTCSDIDECLVGSNGCDVNAFCTNNIGSYSCNCKPGYTGNGYNCTVAPAAPAASVNRDSAISLLVAAVSSTLLIVGCILVIAYVIRRHRRKSRSRKRAAKSNADEETDPLNNALSTAAACKPNVQPYFKYADQLSSGKEVHGICVLDDQLYVVRSPEPDIEVYNSSKLEFIRKLTMPIEAVYPGFMALCPRKKCLYISYYQNKQMRRINVDGVGQKLWPELASQPDGIHVTESSSVLVTFRMENKLVEFDTDGKVLKDIPLELPYPRHGIPFHGDDQFLVCYGFMELTIAKCGVSLVKICDKSMQSVDVRADHPLHVAVDRLGFIAVADFINNGISILDPSLKFSKEVFASAGNDTPEPSNTARMCFDGDNDRLFVGDYSGHVFVFDITYR